MSTLCQNIRYSLRMLLKKPCFTTVAVLSLALAIGVNSGVFTIVNAMFLRPLIPLRPDEVVNVTTSRAAADRGYRPFSFSEFSLLRESHEVFADVAAFRFAAVGVGANSDTEMRRRFGFIVSDNYFSMLGVTPAAGRFFLPEESRPNANSPVAVVSHTLWKSLADSRGFTAFDISINGEPWTVVGVAPPEFSGGNAMFAPDIWLPMGMASRVSRAFGQGRAEQDLADPANFALYLIGRLQPGLTLEAAETRLPAIAARFSMIAADAADGPRTLEISPRSRFNMSTEPSSDGPLHLFGALLLGMAAIVLLVACLNLANMFLARNVTRSQELAVHLALGASRWRVIRILSGEGLIIALIGGASGLLLSYWGNALLLDSLMGSSSLSSLGFSLVLDATPDIRVLLATLIFCTAATLVFAVGPALHTTREIARGSLSLHHSARTTTDRWGRLFSVRHCLLMAQLALSLTLLFSGGLFYRAVYSAARLDPGFAPEGDLVAEIDYSLVDRDDAIVRTSVESIVDTLAAHPAVREVALTSHIPFGHVDNNFDVSAVDDSSSNSPRRASGRLAFISANYFNTIGVKLLRGRDFTDLEWRHPEGLQVVIIDECMAAALFPGEDPVGRYLERTRGPDEASSELMEIIGIVSAHWHKVFSEGPPPRLFFPLARQSPQHVFVHLRGQVTDAVESGALSEQVREMLYALDPGIPLVQLVPFTAILDGNVELWSMRFVSVLFGTFGIIALLLAVVGVYGVKAFTVERRTREIGIRMALGAQPRQVFAFFIRQGALQIAIGLGVGLLLSLATGRLLASMLLRVSPNDPVVLAVAALPLATAAFFACWLPARRAARIDPMEALRYE
jgi:putative ABC transport system permease protein